MNRKIKVYGVPACPFCTMTKKYLKDRGFDFEDVDVSRSQDLAKEMVEKSGQMSVPVIEIDGAIIIGFDKERIEKILRS